MRAFVALVIFLSLFKVSSLFAEERVSASLDIDGNGQYDALTDGLLIVRYLFGLTDSSLTNGTLGSNATRTEPSQIVSLLDSMKDTLDIDGNQSTDALTDGLLILRYLFGLRGDALIDSVIGNDSSRDSASSIETYVQSVMPTVTLIEGNIGSGQFSFQDSTLIGGLSINIFCYIPDGISETTPILFVFHGGGRNPRDYRNAFVSEANEKKFIVIAPEFSSSLFPGGDGYNLGNVFVDGDNPSASSLNDESEWLFSLMDPIFDYVKPRLVNNTSQYSVFGHSAGGQVAHRLMFFKPSAKVEHFVAAGSGWYTTMNNNLSFPYGFENSPLEDSNFSSYLEKRVTILIGELDNDPNAPSLRRNSIVDQQGRNRFDRAVSFYEQARDISEQQQVPFNWTFDVLQNTGHDYIAASERASELLFGTN